MATSVQVVFDCAEPGRLAEFWAVVLGYRVQDPPEGFGSWPEFLASVGVPEERWGDASAVVDPAGLGPRVYFQRVPEGKQVKNRVHLDVNVSGGFAVPLDERRRQVDAEAERLVEAGATRVRAVEEQGEYHLAMLDPEGNEFDVQ